ncbi:diguanylate cyclase [Colwellia sp. 1_MG-2023]|uniref:diguanylate cyclase n=1 Tax=unclassified Colwellia TaxID=196834 RepID=UPI001C087793|nr:MULTISPECIES: diguanylate cyclase [unclassified Colwellia]MBU2926187.1 diguanylate cyclase [Colwellia sp. C2M11]MDO6487314.1 diguanylate cyclase [Colwellia sp. 6_MG-2023]MDO6652392.1 diguanylate cyclase [Colwellia sp. 3_MG-2023]MDO6665733.1 diguanylate cyclase [Colwellia sp. 2_MG-2023]MDO6690106.1 diguanylate cyclase [Colwellia sp. 1_MG-2023]
MQLVFRYVFLVFVTCCFFVANAAKLTDSLALQNIEHALHKEPWTTYQSLLEQADQIDEMSPNYKLWWLLRKAEAENLLYFFDRFEATVEESLAAVHENTPARILINLDIFRGLILQREGHYLRSQKLLKKAQESALANDYIALAVQAKQELAYTLSLTGVYELPLTELQQAYMEAFMLNNEFLIARINEVYGAIYGYMHDYAKSIEYYHKALISYQQLAYPYYEGEAVYGLAVTYRYWGKYELAIEYYKRYRKIIEFSPNNINGKFFAAYGIAMSEASRGSCEQALRSINYAVSIEGLSDYKAELYKRKSECLITEGKLDEAKIALNKAEEIFYSLPELLGTRWQIETLKIEAKLAEAQGNHKEAYKLLEQFNENEIELLKENMSDRLLHVRATLEADRQNVEISLLQQRTKVQQLEFEQQKQANTLQVYVIFFVATLVLIMLFFTYFQWHHNKKLKQLSIRDPLSNSFNRRYVFNFLHKLIDANYDEKNTISIMVIDIDDFKRVNDLYGHPFGDEVIRQVANIGANILRKEDVIGRVGGEEFLCVLPRIDAVQSLHIAQRFVNTVNQHEFITESNNGGIQKIQVSVSIGLATTSKKVNTSTELYLQADKALYHAKRSGKNRAIQYQESMQYMNNSKKNYEIPTFDEK